MKTSLMILPILLLFGLISCNEIETSPIADNTSSARFSKIDKMMMEHYWAVSFFWNAGTDATGQFTNYVMEFREDGTVKASDGEIVVIGLWYSIADHPASRFVMKFYDDGIFAGLTREWTFSEIPFRESELVKLEDMHTGKRDSYFLNLRPF